ncbi:hypothetical protein SOVF_160570 [Spinacia oleracea]|nr:hypothetical protein SOVF_160570 [Spinacia oleracea]
MILLWLTTIIPGATPCDESNTKCTSLNYFRLSVLVSSFGMMSIGAGGVRSSSLAFGTDQLLKEDNHGNTGILERFFNWYYVATCAAIIFAVTCVVYIQDHFGWIVGFGVPVVLMLLSALFFFLASPFYIKSKAEAESPMALAQVFIAYFKKRHFKFSENHDKLYHRRIGSKLVMPSDNLRFLNKACMVVNAEEELTEGGKAIDPWSLCTIETVEELKSLIRVIPIWSTGIIFSINPSPFNVLLTKSMDRHITSNFEIPAGSFVGFLVISAVSWIVIYDLIFMPLATKMMGKPVRLSARKRMGIGILLSCLSMAVNAIVEGIRRETAIKEGFSDDPNGVTDMSALWLLPHLWFSGMADVFFIIGQNEFFCSVFPKSMRSVATNLGGVSMSLASVFSSLILNATDYITSRGGKESWVSSNINKAHFDYYYWVFTGLCLLNFFYYLICNKAYGPSYEEQDDKSRDHEDIGHCTL